MPEPINYDTTARNLRHTLQNAVLDHLSDPDDAHDETLLKSSEHLALAYLAARHPDNDLGPLTQSPYGGYVPHAVLEAEMGLLTAFPNFYHDHNKGPYSDTPEYKIIKTAIDQIRELVPGVVHAVPAYDRGTRPGEDADLEPTKPSQLSPDLHFAQTANDIWTEVVLPGLENLPVRTTGQQRANLWDALEKLLAISVGAAVTPDRGTFGPLTDSYFGQTQVPARLARLEQHLLFSLPTEEPGLEKHQPGSPEFQFAETIVDKVREVVKNANMRRGLDASGPATAAIRNPATDITTSPREDRDRTPGA